MSKSLYYWKIILSYDGNNISGWDGDKKTCIKSSLQRAIKEFCNESPKITCAGRTDAGVHAIGQVCSFSLSKKIKKDSLINGVNYFLPKFIKILNVKQVESNFSARFSAKYRIYRYFISHNQKMPPILLGKCLYIKNKLNINNIKKAIQSLIGKYDISTFCPNKYTGKRIRSIENIKIITTKMFDCKLTVIEFKAQSFAHHQVRNMIGCLIEVGLGRWSIEDLINKINQKDRVYGANTAQPHGLYLWKVEY